MTKKTKLLILIPLLAAMLNGVGYLVAVNMRAKEPERAAGTGGPAAPVSTRGLSDDLTRTAAKPADDKEPTSADSAREEKALARRAAGLAALDAGDYGRALADFAEARSLAGDKAYVSELLRVTEDLAQRAQLARRAPLPRPVAPVRPLPPPPPSHFANRTHVPERTIAKETPGALEASVPAPAQPAAPPTTGLLLVTTTPRGLLVQVDDVPVDLSPTRASLKLGSHHVAFFDGDRKVYETNVEVKAGSPTTLLRDLSAELAPPPVPAQTPFAKERVAEENASAAPAPAAQPVPATSARRAGTQSAGLAQSLPPPLAPQTGSLDITSPGLYGEIWINGRPRGFPPLHAEDLPVGRNRIGVRVNGVERRWAFVAVRPGLTTSVRLGRQEAVP